MSSDHLINPRYDPIPGRPHRPSAEYRTWQDMKLRCTAKHRKDWKNYGGRGITICERWVESFDNFFADMGKRPSPKHQLDRRDNDGPYSPENCRWATKSEQMRNKRDTHMVTWNGRTQCLQAWANELGIDRDTLHIRLKRWTVDQAFTTPISYGGDRRNSLWHK